MKLKICLTLVLLTLLTSLFATVVVSGNNVTMTRADLEELVAQAKMYHEIKDRLNRPQIYLGTNAGTYGVGVNAGIIF